MRAAHPRLVERLQQARREMQPRGRRRDRAVAPREDRLVVGIVRRLEIQDPSGPVRFYSVEDLQHRILGEADDQGRFTRRVPFRDTGEDLGVWALPRGVGLLFEASAPADLRPVALEAAGKRSDGAR